ncbi:MAG: DUF374 domain-containing protein [Alphaproteobacteria bacterium]
MIAGLLEKFGLGTIGGSSNENASGAAVKLMHSLKDDTAICIIPDGPGAPGCIWDALLFIMRKNRKTYRLYFVQHRQLFPHNKILGPHDDPLPFSRGICTVSETISVPADADNNELKPTASVWKSSLTE